MTDAPTLLDRVHSAVAFAGEEPCRHAATDGTLSQCAAQAKHVDDPAHACACRNKAREIIADTLATVLEACLPILADFAAECVADSMLGRQPQVPGIVPAALLAAVTGESPPVTGSE